MNSRCSIQVTSDGSRTAHSTRYSQTYHSHHGAVTEARHVFLEPTGIEHRLRQQLDTQVLEIGFGLGLNALLTADLALSMPPEHRPNLSYHAFEHDLIDIAFFEALNYESVLSHPELAKSMATLLRDIHALCDNAETPARTEATHSAILAPGFRLTIHLQDATAAESGTKADTNPTTGEETNDGALNTTTTPELSGGFFTAHKKVFHAIYLDAFSPDTNAECWTPEFIARLAEALADTGYLSTYSAKGTVRRAMLAANLQVQKLPGPKGKREILLAHR